MDMREPFIQSTLEAVPLAFSKIAFDRFHVMRHMTESVDVVRRRENRMLLTEDDNRRKGTKYLWIYSMENVHPERRAEFRFLRGSDLKTGRA
jgi:transposase